MRVKATLSYAVRVAPEGAAHIPILFETMRVWREAIRHAMWWCLERKVWSDKKGCWKSPSLARAHVALYRELRERTSSTCPTCDSRLNDAGNRRLRCPGCGLEGDRDLIGAMNLGMRGVQAAPMAPDADEAPISGEGEVERLEALAHGP